MNGDVHGCMYAVDSRFIHPGEVGVIHPSLRGHYSPTFTRALFIHLSRGGGADSSTSWGV